MCSYEMAEDNEIGFNEGDKVTNINKVSPFFFLSGVIVVVLRDMRLL